MDRGKQVKHKEMIGIDDDILELESSVKDADNFLKRKENEHKNGDEDETAIQQKELEITEANSQKEDEDNKVLLESFKDSTELGSTIPKEQIKGDKKAETKTSNPVEAQNTNSIIDENTDKKPETMVSNDTADAQIYDSGEGDISLEKGNWLQERRKDIKENPQKYIVIGSIVAGGLFVVRKITKRFKKHNLKNSENNTEETKTGDDKVKNESVRNGENESRNEGSTKEEPQNSEGNADNKEKKEEDKKENKESFWSGPAKKFLGGVGGVLGGALAGGGLYWLVHGIYTGNREYKDLLDWEKGKKLNFEAAMSYCKGAILNQDNKEGMSYGMDLNYHEDESEIEAYGERVKINKNKRMIEGLDVEFKKYEHMISTAILIAYLKKTYSGQCATDAPFYLTNSMEGDLNLNSSNGKEEAVDATGIGGRVSGITAAGIAGILSGIFGGLKTGVAVTAVGGIVGTLGGYAYDTNNIVHKNMPELDNESGMKNLGAYLNDMNCRKVKNQSKEDIEEIPIKEKIWTCIEEIQNSCKELPERGGRRKFNIIQDKIDKNKYKIEVYGRAIESEVTGSDGNEEIRILGISGGNPTIKTDMKKGDMENLKLPLNEGIYMSMFIGFLLDNFSNKGKDYPWFEYGGRNIRLAPGILAWNSINGKKNNIRGIYFNNKKNLLDGITSGQLTDTLALSRENFKKRMPTLFKEENRKKFLEFLNDGITDNENISIRKK